MNPMVHFLKQLTDRISPLSYSAMNQSDAKSIAYIRQLQRELKKEEVLETPLSELSVVVFDLETTGFYPNRGDKILSIGAVKVDGTNVRKDNPFYSLIQSYDDPPNNIVELTGITKIELEKAPPIDKVLHDFFHYIGHKTLVAHHAGHERNFMQHVSKSILRTNFEHRIVDTSFLTKITKSDNPLITLDECCTHFGINIVKRHHALHDAMATAELWSTCINEIKELGFVHLRDVYAHLAK